MADHTDVLTGISANAPNPPHPPPQTSTPSSIAGSSAGAVLNPRSCVTCRRRKVRCNKLYPCSNCQKAHIDCIFPAPGRAPRRPRKPPDGELLARLRRLEGVVQSLGVQVDDEEGEPSGNDKAGSSSGAQVKHEAGVDTEVIGDVNSNSLNESFGRLVIDEKGRSRYVNNRFWAALSNEVEDLKQILDEDSEEETDAPSPMTDVMNSPGTHNYLFNGTSMVDFQSQHPPPNLIREYWQTYLEYYDPLMRMLHVPTTQKLIFELMRDPSKASRAEETLLFAIYFAAVSALPSEELQQKTGETRDALQKKFRQATEQALARSHLLFTEEILLLQAFIIYLYTLRRFEDSRVIWSLCGLACRIAITMGLHRDGSNFAISPLDIEIRRRLWWQILTLDIRAAEYHGWDPVIVQHSFDTKYPLNVEDEDLFAQMPKPPAEREGITSISFCITRYNTAMLYAKLHTRPSTAFDVVINSMRSRPGERRIGITLQEKEKWIQDCQKHLEEKFFKFCNPQDENHWLAATLTRMIFSKQWLSLLHPYLRLDRGASLSRATKERIFTISLESVEYALLIHEQCMRVKWGWLFQNWSQFHALASLLSELRTRTDGPLVDRAWQAVDASVESFGQKNGDGKNGHTLWKPIRKLYETAKAAREHALATVDTDEEEESDIDVDETELSQMKTEESDYAIDHSAYNSTAFARTNGSLAEQNVPAVPNQRLNSYAMPGNQMPLPQPQQQQQYNPLHPRLHHDWPGTSNPQQKDWYYGSNNAMPSAQNNNVWGPMSNMGGTSMSGSISSSHAPNGNTANAAPNGLGFDGQDQQAFGELDPMLGAGFGAPEDFGMQWNEWEEMMRDFESHPGNGGVQGGGPPPPAGGAGGGAGFPRETMGEWL